MLNAEYIDTLCAWMETPVGSSEEAELDVELLALEDHRPNRTRAWSTS